MGELLYLRFGHFCIKQNLLSVIVRTCFIIWFGLLWGWICHVRIGVLGWIYPECTAASKIIQPDFHCLWMNFSSCSRTSTLDYALILEQPLVLSIKNVYQYIILVCQLLKLVAVDDAVWLFWMPDVIDYYSLFHFHPFFFRVHLFIWLPGNSDDICPRTLVSKHSMIG